MPGLPVIELIAENVLATVQGIKAAAGFNYDLTAQRHTRKGDKREHLNAIIVQEDPKDITNVPNTKEWKLVFGIGVYIMPAETDPTAIDTYVNLVRSDVERAIMLDRYRGANAINTIVKEPETAVDEESVTDLVVINAEVHYRTSELDPRVNAK